MDTPEYTPKDIARFWSKVKVTSDIDSCWEWQASKGNKYGHGQFYANGKRDFSHRVSWKIKNGAIPNKMCVLHKCDNPSCVNPNHLFLGTRQDNTRDMLEKHRQGRKLTIAQVDEIRRRYFEESATKEELAQEFSVHITNIHAIVIERTWRY